MSCCYRSSNCSGVTVFTIWSSLFFLACRQVVKSQLRHDYTASSSPFPRFRKFDAFPFPLQFRNSGIPRFTIGPYELVLIGIHSQDPLKLTGVKQMECCCDPIRIVNALRCLHWQQLTDSGLSKTMRVMTMNQSKPSVCRTLNYRVSPVAQRRNWEETQYHALLALTLSAEVAFAQI